MKVSSILDKNVVSGTVLLENILPLHIVLQHKVSFNGVDKYIDLNSVDVVPNSKYFDYMFINLHYYTNLYIDINGQKFEVIEGGLSDDESINPLNNRMYTEINDEIEQEITVVNSELYEPLIETVLNHSPMVNLSSLSSFNSTGHFLHDNINGLRADVTKNDLILSNTININNSTEVTIAITGDKPDVVKIYNVRTSGLTLINNQRYYELDSKHCYTTNIINPTEDIEVQLIYLKNFQEFKSIYIEDFFISNVSQYVPSEPQTRSDIILESNLPESHHFVFNYKMIPNFGLRTIASIYNDNTNLLIQASNSKLLFTKLIDDIIYYSEIISNINISGSTVLSIYQNPEVTKFYINNSLVKTVLDDLSISGPVNISLGRDSNQQHDSNSEIKIAVYNENKNE